MRKMEIPVCLETTVCARSNRDLAHFFPQRVYVRSGKSLKIVCVFVGPLSLQLRMFANTSASARPRTPAPICAVYRQPPHYASVLTRVGFKVRGTLWAGSRRQPKGGKYRVKMASVVEHRRPLLFVHLRSCRSSGP